MGRSGRRPGRGRPPKASSSPTSRPNAAAIADSQKAADGTWTGVYVGALGLCVNEQVIEELGIEVPDSWDDLLDPALAGNVSVAHPASSGTAYTTFYTQVLRLGGEDEGLAYMKAAASQHPAVHDLGLGPGQMAGRGEVAVGIIFSHDCVKNIEGGFEDLVVSFPTDGTGYEIGAVALVANAAYPDNAEGLDRLVADGTGPGDRPDGGCLPAAHEPRRGGQRPVGRPVGRQSRGLRLPGRGRGPHAG